MTHSKHELDNSVNTNVMKLARTITQVNSLAERLKYARELRNLTQEQLAAEAKCSQGTIGNVEAGIRKSMRSLVVVARALEVSVEWLSVWYA